MSNWAALSLSLVGTKMCAISQFDMIHWCAFRSEHTAYRMSALRESVSNWNISKYATNSVSPVLAELKKVYRYKLLTSQMARVQSHQNIQMEI